MLVEHQDIEVHYASFKELAEDVVTISRFASKQSPGVRPITYHTLNGPTYGAALNSVGHAINETIGGPGIAGITKLCSDIQKYLMPWTGPEYLAIYQQITSILEKVDPAIVAVDPQFGPGLMRFEPLDIFFSVYNKDLLWLTQSSVEADFPLSVIPSNVIACGPIFLSTAPAAEQAEEMAIWLQRAPTVLINLGSTVNYDETSASEMARAVKELLENSSVQVLWKFNKRSEFSDSFLAGLEESMAQRRLRLEKWIKTDPASLLETGNVVLSVHHGGANCYHEAVGTGVPQMVLPMWVDLYDYATRVEWLGIGVWGNQESAPYWTAEELGVAFQRVLGDGEAAISMQNKAAELGDISKKTPGRSVAARELAKQARLGASHVATP